MKCRAIICSLLLLAAQMALGYETQTHAFMVSESIKRSVLEDPTQSPALLARLGFDRLDASRPFGLYWLFIPTNYINAPLSAVGPEYYDNLSSATNSRRCGQGSEQAFPRSRRRLASSPMALSLGIARSSPCCARACQMESSPACQFSSRKGTMASGASIACRSPYA